MHYQTVLKIVNFYFTFILSIFPLGMAAILKEFDECCWLAN